MQNGGIGKIRGGGYTLSGVQTPEKGDLYPLDTPTNTAKNGVKFLKSNKYLSVSTFEYVDYVGGWSLGFVSTIPYPLYDFMITPIILSVLHPS